ncbi:MAG: helix-turn-helix transcriptional regulator [Limosilactobacillus mucosae]
MPTYVPHEVKHTIRDLRIRANMSQNSAAKALGISEPTLRKWENDSSSLTFRDMQRIAELYSIPLDYIFFGPDNAFSEK